MGISCWQRKFLPNIRQFVTDLSPQTGQFMGLFKNPQLRVTAM